MSEPIDITTELNALADQLQQDREAGVFLDMGKAEKPLPDEVSRLKQMRDAITRVSLDQQTGGGIASPYMDRQFEYCDDICLVLARLDHLEAENARLRENQREMMAHFGQQSNCLLFDLMHCNCSLCECNRKLTAATSRAEQAERERDELRARLRVEDGR